MSDFLLFPGLFPLLCGPLPFTFPRHHFCQLLGQPYFLNVALRVENLTILTLVRWFSSFFTRGATPLVRPLFPLPLKFYVAHRVENLTILTLARPICKVKDGQVRRYLKVCFNLLPVFPLGDY